MLKINLLNNERRTIRISFDYNPDRPDYIGFGSTWFAHEYFPIPSKKTHTRSEK